MYSRKAYFRGFLVPRLRCAEMMFAVMMVAWDFGVGYNQFVSLFGLFLWRGLEISRNPIEGILR